jgi:hypothetical protein
MVIKDKEKIKKYFTFQGLLSFSHENNSDPRKTVTAGTAHFSSTEK